MCDKIFNFSAHSYSLFYAVFNIIIIYPCHIELKNRENFTSPYIGGSLLDIAEVTGHKTMQMVKRYSHLTQKHTAKLLQDTTDIILKRIY